LIKAVVFDFGNVLCRLDRPSMDEALASHSPFDQKRVEAIIWGTDIELAAETGRVDARGHFRRIKEAIRGEESWTFDSFAEECMRCLLPHPEGESALAMVHDKGLRTFILSNTSFLHARFIFERETLATIPELYALSYKVGCMKPDPRIWLWLLERSGLDAKDCIYVDDIQTYCDAAASLGFSSYRYDISSANLLQALQGML
jgi:FMN phosphatase YigB (HAD superfamily)